MKKIILILFSVYSITACQSSLVNTDINTNNSGNDVNLSTQYSDNKLSGKTAADVNTQLGAGYIANGRYDRALIKLNKAIRQEPDHALAHNYLGVLYGRLERPEHAVTQFNKSLQLAPNDSTILNNYAVFLCEQNQFSKAEQIFKKVINNPLYIKRAEAYQSAGWCALKNNELDRADKLYRKALAISPELGGALFGLAKVHYKKANYDYAWSYFLRYDKLSLPDANALWLGINILKKLTYPDKNLLSSYELQLKSKYPDSDESRWLYQGKQDY